MWDDQGKLLRQCGFENGLQHGEARAWHPNGKQESEGRFDAARRTGEWRYWKEDGTLDLERSGLYADDVRTAPLPQNG